MSMRFFEPVDVFAITMMLIGYIIIIPIIIISIHHDYSAKEPETAQAIQAAGGQPAMVQQCQHQCPYHHGGGQRQ